MSNRLLPAVKSHPEGVLAAAVPYLSQAVIVSNGWLMGRAAHACIALSEY